MEHAKALLARVQDRTATLAIVGLGYVGLPTAVAFAETGFSVLGIDVDERRVSAVQRGENPLPELGLEAGIRRARDAGRLRASTDPLEAGGVDVVLLIVPTPVTVDKQPDLSYVESASKSVASVARPGQLVVLESTTYPGCTEDMVCAALRSAGLEPGRDIGVAYCPERYNPGDTEHTLDQVARVVGAIDADWAQVASALYGTLNGGQIHIARDLRTAEASKVIENVQRDLNIALANELALICERLHIDVHEVIDAAATKWNFVPYRPGPGVGGHCLPVDPYYLTWAAERAGHEAKVILAGRAVNDGMPMHVVARLNAALGGLAGKSIAVLGLAYKGGTGDARESPSVDVVRHLVAAGAAVRPHDPHVSAEDVLRSCGLESFELADAVAGADAVVLLTDHTEYRAVEPAWLAERMTGEVVLDTRRLWSEADLAAAGLRPLGIGRPSAAPTSVAAAPSP